MKKILISALVAGCTVLGAERVVLDAKLVYQDGEVASLYDDYQKLSSIVSYESQPATNTSVSFYVNVNQMLGARKLKKNKEYMLTSISWNSSIDGTAMNILDNESCRQALVWIVPTTKTGDITARRYAFEPRR